MSYYDVEGDYNAANTNDNNNFSCLDFSKATDQIVIKIKVSLSVITVFANLLAIFLIFKTKKFKDTTFRLAIYLMITDILQAIAMCLALIPIEVPEASEAPFHAEVRPNSTAMNDFCQATGFILMTTMWMGNIVIIWIVLHLLVLGWRLYRLQVTKTDTGSTVEPSKNSKIYRKCELYGILFLITAPIIIGMIPLFLPNEMYGISGLWCWIKIVSSSCTTIKKESLIVVFTFFYGPLILIVLFSTISMLSTIVFVCYGAVRRRTFVDQHQQRMKEIMFVLAYPMLYCTVCLILLANRVYSLANATHPPFMRLWYAHTVADPVRVLLPAVAFLLHPSVWGAICTRKKTIVTPVDSRTNHEYGPNTTGESMEDEKLLKREDNGRNVHYQATDNDSDEKTLSHLVESK